MNITDLRRRLAKLESRGAMPAVDLYTDADGVRWRCNGIASPLPFDTEEEFLAAVAAHQKKLAEKEESFSHRD